MNNISGQMYLQTSQMATLLNNSSQGLGVMSQMLLQMQQSYLVQSAIQGILNGWSNNSGRAVKVEII